METTRIHRLSSFLRWAAAVAAIGLVGLLLTLIVYPPAMVGVVESQYGQISETGVTTAKHLLLSLLAFVAALPTLRSLQMLWRLFTTYSHGEVLSQTAASTLQSLGRAVLLMAVPAMLAPTLVVLILTYDNPPGLRQLSFHLSSNIYALLLFGGLITTIGWAMVEAARVDADNKAII